MTTFDSSTLVELDENSEKHHTHYTSIVSAQAIIISQIDLQIFNLFFCNQHLITQQLSNCTTTVKQTNTNYTHAIFEHYIFQSYQWFSSWFLT